jgi:hypothetical protein
LKRRLIGQPTKDALAVRRAQGVQLGRPRDMPAKLVRRIEAMREKGVSIRGIADALNDAGVPTAAESRSLAQQNPLQSGCIRRWIAIAKADDDCCTSPLGDRVRASMAAP